MKKEDPEKTRTIIDRKRKWYAVYTQARHEKKIAQKLDEKHIEYYLPLHKILKIWSDRKKWVEEPVFKSYIFVRIGLSEYKKVIETEGIVSFVRFGTFPEAIPDKVISDIKCIFNSEENFEISDIQLSEGDEVKIVYGPLKGIYGKLIEIQGKYKLVINVEILGKSIIVNVSRKHVEKLEKI